MWNVIWFSGLFVGTLYMFTTIIADKVEKRLKDRFDAIEDKMDLIIDPSKVLDILD